MAGQAAPREVGVDAACHCLAAAGVANQGRTCQGRVVSGGSIRGPPPPPAAAAAQAAHQGQPLLAEDKTATRPAKRPGQGP